MDNQNSGWDKINQQETQSKKKTKLKENVDTAANITDYISWIILIVLLVVAGLILGVNFFK